MHGEVAQPRLACDNRLRRPPHVTYDQAAEHRERGDRDSDVGQHAFRDLAAGLCRLPCQAGDGAALRIGNGGHVLIAGLGRFVDPVQAGELQPIANLAQQVVVDIFDGKDHRR